MRTEDARWPATLEAIVKRAAVGLDAAAGKGVVAELYKLLIYDAGGSFVRHRNTEKSPGMFATLNEGNRGWCQARTGKLAAVA